MHKQHMTHEPDREKKSTNREAESFEDVHFTHGTRAMVHQPGVDTALMKQMPARSRPAVFYQSNTEVFSWTLNEFQWIDTKTPAHHLHPDFVARKESI